ncbi:MAG: D-Ala-D-Ala carboxypeptidase family metallohydrolase [Longimicrobiales bacterium]
MTPDPTPRKDVDDTTAGLGRQAVAFAAMAGAVLLLLALRSARPAPAEGVAVRSAEALPGAARVDRPGGAPEPRHAVTRPAPARHPWVGRPSGPTTRESMMELGLDIRIAPGRAAGPGVDERRIEYPLESLFVLPGDTVRFQATVADGTRLSVDADGGDLRPGRGAGWWTWIAPDEPGLSRVDIRHPGQLAEVRLHAFTLTPATDVERGFLNGYRIGTYPARALSGNPLYRVPEGFVEITEANEDTRVSPHFQLRHFPAKQGATYPKYVVLRPALLRKLERVIDALGDRGYPVRSLHVMSGYRTPYYNVSVLGNVRYSRHQWGGAADVFVDERPKNGRMDDLNGDGRVSLADARVVHSVVDSLDLDMGANVPIGGLGLYAANSVRGPFVHIDVRGVAARW